MAWQIQARNKCGAEPVSVVKPHELPDGEPERTFEYETFAQAVDALKHFLETADSLANVIVRMIHPRPRFLSRYQVRLAYVSKTVDAATILELQERYEYQADIEAHQDGPK